MMTSQPFPVWVKGKRKVVASSNSILLDTLLLSQFSTLRYKLSIFNTSENKNYTSDLLIGKSPSGVVSVLTNKVNFSNIDVEINDTDDGTTFNLSIINNESFELFIEHARLTLKQ